MKNLLLVLALAAPLSAHAGLISYDFTGTSNSGWTANASVILDEADVVAGTNLVGDFVNWAFSWTNGTDTHSSSDADSTLLSSSFFLVDAGLNVAHVNLCTDNCNTAGHPEFVAFIASWNATTDAGATVPGIKRGSWSGPVAVAEPGTLGLLGLGLLGLIAVRRKA